MLSIICGMENVRKIMHIIRHFLGLFFLGRRIPNGSKLSECPGLGNHHKVYAMRVARPVQSTYKPTAYDIDNARSALHSALSDHHQRVLVLLFIVLLLFS